MGQRGPVARRRRRRRSLGALHGVALAGAILLGTPSFAEDTDPDAKTSEETRPRQEMRDRGEEAKRQEARFVAPIDLARVTDRMAGVSGYHIAVPKLDTKVTIAGFVKADLIHDFRETGAPAQFIPITIVVPTSNQGQTTFSANPSRFIAGSATDAKLGRITTMVSFDFFGEQTGRNPEPRLRQAWGQIDGFLAGWGLRVGQSWSSWDDVSALPETLDFEGPNGSDQTRHTLLRLIRHLGDDWVLWVSIEDPQSVIAGGSFETRSPDGVIALQHNGRFGHVKVSALLRDLGGDAGFGTVHTFGWGVQSTGLIKMPDWGCLGRDDFRYQIQYGKGIGRYVDAGLTDAVVLFRNITALPYFSGYVAYRHFWTQRFRSTAAFGWVDVENVPSQPPTTFTRTYYTATNIIFSPIEAVDLGAEFLWGERTNQNGQQGTGLRMQFSARFSF